MHACAYFKIEDFNKDYNVVILRKRLFLLCKKKTFLCKNNNKRRYPMRSQKAHIAGAAKGENLMFFLRYLFLEEANPGPLILLLQR